MKQQQIAQKMSDANSVHAMQVQAPISIKAETAIADPDTCKFTVSTIVQAGGPFFFTDTVQAASAPLAATLFAQGKDDEAKTILTRIATIEETMGDD